MAVAKMEKVHLTFKVDKLDLVLQLLQGFQGLHIETGYESSVPAAKKLEIDQEIMEIESRVQGILAASSLLKGRKSSRMLGVLQDTEEKQLTIAELTKTVEESDWEKILEEIIQTDRRLQDNHKRREEVSGLFEALRIWEGLGYNPLLFSRLTRSMACIGSVHEKHAEDFIVNLQKHEENGIFFEKVATHAERVYFFVLYHVDALDNVQVFMKEFSFSAEDYPFDKPQVEMRVDLENEVERLRAEEAEILTVMQDQEKYDSILHFAEDYLLNVLLRRRKSLQVTYDGDNIAINGWVQTDRRELFERILTENLLQREYVLVISSVQEDDISDVPIKLENSPFVSIYERLTEMYSMPRYNEIDPTPVMTLFYMVFFGLMVADAGYGLAVFLVGFVIKRWLKLKRSTKSFMDFLFYLSFPIMGWGLVFGQFCGIDLPFHLISASIDIIPLTLLSIGFGFFHIMAGLVLHMLNQIKLKQYFDMITGGLAWFVTFLGGAIMLLSHFWLGNMPLFRVGAVFSGAGLCMTLIVPAIQYGKRWYAGFGKGLFTLYNATSYLGDFVSYARLMALGVAGGNVAKAFNTILSFLPLPAKLTLGVVLAVVLHSLNIFLTMLSAYVHGMRLQFIEFFGKFYTGGGKPFTPFKAAEKNVIITEDAGTGSPAGAADAGSASDAGSTGGAADAGYAAGTGSSP